MFFASTGWQHFFFNFAGNYENDHTVIASIGLTLELYLPIWYYPRRPFLPNSNFFNFCNLSFSFFYYSKLLCLMWASSWAELIIIYYYFSWTKLAPVLQLSKYWYFKNPKYQFMISTFGYLSNDNIDFISLDMAVQLQ